MKRLIYIFALLMAISSPMFAQFECSDFSNDFDTEMCVTSNVEKVSKKPIIYPNPVYDVLNIESEIEVDIQIVDIMGRLLISSKGKSIDVSDLPQGSYLVVIDRRYTAQFIKI